MKQAEKLEKKSVDREQKEKEDRKAKIQAMNQENLYQQKQKQDLSKQLNQDIEAQTLKMSIAMQDEVQKQKYWDYLERQKKNQQWEQRVA